MYLRLRGGTGVAQPGSGIHTYNVAGAVDRQEPCTVRVDSMTVRYDHRQKLLDRVVVHRAQASTKLRAEHQPRCVHCDQHGGEQDQDVAMRSKSRVTLYTLYTQVDRLAQTHDFARTEGPLRVVFTMLEMAPAESHSVKHPRCVPRVRQPVADSTHRPHDGPSSAPRAGESTRITRCVIPNPTPLLPTPTPTQATHTPRQQLPCVRAHLL